MSFASLPYELRSHIWSLAVEPRRITGIRMEMSDGKFTKRQRDRGKDVLYETTSTPPPAVVQVCREARQYAPYQRCFTTGSEARWTWVNFGVDIFCVTSVYDISDIVSHRSNIQRLQIRTDDDPDWCESTVHHNALRVLNDFTSLRDVKIVLEPGDRNWAYQVERKIFKHCPSENVALIDEGSGLVLTGPQLRLVGDWRRRLSFDLNPPDPDGLSEQSTYMRRDSWCMSMAKMHEID